MNEITVTSMNLPDNIEDLSKFVLFGRDQMTAVRAAIRRIEKIGVAKEVVEQKRKEAQELAEAVLDAEVRMGVLLREIPTAQGQRTDLELPQPTLEKSKTKIIQDNGFNLESARQFEQMSRHPEAVAAAKAEARESDEVVTRSAVLEKIKAEKKRLEEENAELKKIVVELKDKPPEIREVQVVPADYKAAKQKARAYDADLRTANNKITEANRAKCEAEEKIRELEDKIAEISTETPQGEYFKNLEAWAVSFNTHCDQFIRWVGGYVWLTNNADKLDDAQLAGLVGSVQMVYEWAGTLLTNIQERTRGKYEHRDNETDQHYLIGADD